MNKKIIKFGDSAIEEHKFHPNKNPISTNNVDINKILVSHKVSFGKKRFRYFIG